MTAISRERLAALIKREQDSYAAHFPRSQAAFRGAGEHLLGGVPMTWMRMWAGGFPVYQATAHGARLTDIDGHELIDFCLGDTGAMAGHSPAPVAEAIARRYTELGGATTMLPTEDAAWQLRQLLDEHITGQISLAQAAAPAYAATAVGFYAQAHLTRHFKKHTATTPAGYARSHAKAGLLSRL